MTPDEGFLKPSFAALLDAYVDAFGELLATGLQDKPEVLDRRVRVRAARAAVLAAHAEVVEALASIETFATEMEEATRKVRANLAASNDISVVVIGAQIAPLFDGLVARLRALSSGGTR